MTPPGPDLLGPPGRPFPNCGELRTAPSPAGSRGQQRAAAPGGGSGAPQVGTSITSPTSITSKREGCSPPRGYPPPVPVRALGAALQGFGGRRRGGSGRFGGSGGDAGDALGFSQQCWCPPVLLLSPQAVGIAAFLLGHACAHPRTHPHPCKGGSSCTKPRHPPRPPPRSPTFAVRFLGLRVSRIPIFPPVSPPSPFPEPCLRPYRGVPPRCHRPCEPHPRAQLAQLLLGGRGGHGGGKRLADRKPGRSACFCTWVGGSPPLGELIALRLRLQPGQSPRMLKEEQI